MVNIDDPYGRDTFREIGRLSSLLPSYVRHCCRSIYDGTDDEVLDAYREEAFKVLTHHVKKYGFVEKHMDLFKLYDPEMMKEMIQAHVYDSLAESLYCLATSSNTGLPKRACLHCPKVARWIATMKRAGTMNPETGERYGYK